MPNWVCAVCGTESFDGQRHKDGCPTHPQAALLRRISELERHVEYLMDKDRETLL